MLKSGIESTIFQHLLYIPLKLFKTKNNINNFKSLQAVPSITIKIFQPAQMTTHLTRCILSLAHVGFYVLPSSVCFVIIIIGGSSGLLFLFDKEAPKKELRDFFLPLLSIIITTLSLITSFNVI